MKDESSNKLQEGNEIHKTNWLQDYKTVKEILITRMSEGVTDNSSSNSLQNMQIITFTFIGLRLAYKRCFKKSLYSHSSISELNCKTIPIPNNWNSNK